MIYRYNTICEQQKAMIVRKKSKFICVIENVETEEEANTFISRVKKEYYDARHHCVASIIGVDHVIEKSNDDGEPSGTAGKPMLEVLKGASLTNVCAVVVRYFGGTLLGTGGLIKAYTMSIQETLKACKIVQYKLCEELIVKLDYSLLAKVEYEMRKSEQIIIDTKYYEYVDLVIMVEVDQEEVVYNRIVEITNDNCEISKKGRKYIVT